MLAKLDFSSRSEKKHIKRLKIHHKQEDLLLLSLKLKEARFPFIIIEWRTG